MPMSVSSIGVLIKDSVPFILASGQTQPKVTLVRIIELLIMVILSLYMSNEFIQRDVDKIKADLQVEQQKREKAKEEIMFAWKEERAELKDTLQKMAAKLDQAYEESRAQADLSNIRGKIRDQQQEYERRIERLENRIPLQGKSP